MLFYTNVTLRCAAPQHNTQVTLAISSTLAAMLTLLLFVALSTFTATHATITRPAHAIWRQAGQPRMCQNKTQAQPNLTLDVVHDSTLCGQYGNNKSEAAIAIRLAFAQAEAPFRKQLCLRLSVRSVSGWCDKSADPWRGEVRRRRPRELLSSFCATRNGSMLHMHFLVTGGGSNARTVALAFMGAACNTDISCAWAQGLAANLLAHELGHALNARHSKSGDVMAPQNAQRMPLLFHARAVTAMTQFLRSPRCRTAGGKPEGVVPDGTDAWVGKRERKVLVWRVVVVVVTVCVGVLVLAVLIHTVRLLWRRRVLARDGVNAKDGHVNGDDGHVNTKDAKDAI